MALEIFIQEYIGEETAESGTTTTNICITGHGLAAGDHIINATRNSTPPAFDNIASRRVTSVVDANNITVHTITGQTTGDTIKLFKHINRADKLMAGSLQINRQSDNNHTCTMTLVSTVDYAPRAGQDVIIKYDNDIIFGGVIKSVRRRLSPASNTIFYDIFSDGYSTIPARRTVTNTHDNTTAGALVEYYVDTVLYQEGVTKGTINAGATLAEYDAVCKSIKEIFDELASASGYKWYIDDNKALHFLQDDMVSDAPHDLDNDTFKDFGNVEYEETLDNYRNKQYIRGALGDEGYVIQHESVNGAEVAVRQEIEGTSGYYGAVLNDNNIDNDTDATNTADNLIKRYGQCLPNVITFETGALDFAPNTRLKVELSELGIDESYYYIEEVSIYDLNGKTLRATVRAVQRSAENFSTQRSQDFIGYFSKLVDMAKSGTVKDGSVASLSQPYMYFFNIENDEQIIVSGETELHGIELTTKKNAKIAFTLNMDVTASEAMTITVKARVDGIEHRKTVKYFDDSYKDGICFSGLFAAVDEGTHIFDISIMQDTGTVTIDPEEYHLVLAVENVVSVKDYTRKQDWDNYPSTPDLTIEYPYQAIIEVDYAYGSVNGIQFKPTNIQCYYPDKFPTTWPISDFSRALLIAYDYQTPNENFWTLVQIPSGKNVYRKYDYSYKRWELYFTEETTYERWVYNYNTKQWTHNTIKDNFIASTDGVVYCPLNIYTDVWQSAIWRAADPIQSELVAKGYYTLEAFYNGYAAEDYKLLLVSRDLIWAETVSGNKEFRTGEGNDVADREFFKLYRLVGGAWVQHETYPNIYALQVRAADLTGGYVRVVELNTPIYDTFAGIATNTKLYEKTT